MVRQLNLPVGVTKIAQEQHFLHTVMMILCTVIFIAVFSVMFYSIWKHRKSVGHKAANFHESVVVEVIWTIVPFIIVILMALPATKVLVGPEGHGQRRSHHQDHGLSVEMGLRLPERRGPGSGLILDARQLAACDVGCRRQGRRA